jgi:hypothetical protein
MPSSMRVRELLWLVYIAVVLVVLVLAVVPR